MKITIEVDATPEEVRRFFGLPDVTPLYEEMLTATKGKIQSGLEGYDPFSLMKTMLPDNLATLEAIQKAFTSAGTPKAAPKSGSGKTKPE